MEFFENTFHLSAAHTTIRTEILAGLQRFRALCGREPVEDLAVSLCRPFVRRCDAGGEKVARCQRKLIALLGRSIMAVPRPSAGPYHLKLLCSNIKSWEEANKQKEQQQEAAAAQQQQDAATSKVPDSN